MEISFLTQANPRRGGRALMKFAACCALVGIAGCSQPQSSVEESLARAEEYRAEGEYRSAVIELKNFLVGAPQDAQVRSLLGSIYLEMGDLPSAEKELNRAHSLSPSDLGVRVSLAKVLLRIGKYEKFEELIGEVDLWPETLAPRAQALQAQAQLAQGRVEQAQEILESALSSHPDDEEVLITQAMLLFHNELFDQSQAAISRLRGKSPNHARALIYEGLLANQRGDLDQARKHFEAVLALQPGNQGVRLDLAALLRRLDEPEAAKQQVQTVLSALPAHPVANYYMADLVIQEGDYRLALDYIDRVLAAVDNHVPTHYLAAVAALQAERFERAYHHAVVVTSLAPGTPAALKLKAAVEFKLGRSSEAIETLSGIRPDDFTEKDAALVAAAGDAALNSGRYEMSRELFQRASELTPDDATLSLRKGVAALGLGDTESAIEVLARGLEQSSESEFAQLAVVLSHIRSGELDLALNRAHALQESYPSNPHGYTMEGLAMAFTGQPEAAREAFEKALALEPGEPNASQNLAALAVQQKDYARAREVLGQLLDVHPKNLKGLVALAKVETQDNQLAAALGWLQQAISAHPKALEPRLLMMDQLLKFGRPVSALNLGAEVLPTYPRDPDLLYLVGRAQKAAGAFERGEETFKKLLIEEPDHLAGHYQLADIYEKTGRYGLATQHVERSFVLQPDYPASLLVLGRIKLKGGALDEAKAALARLKRHAAGNMLAVELEAQIALVEGQSELAVSLFESIYDQRKTTALTMQLATARWNLGRRDEAIRFLADWLEAFPKDMAVRNVLANFYLMDDRAELARQAFATIVERTPNNAWAQNTLAWFLHQDGDLEQALFHARKARTLAPGNPQIMDTLGMILLDRGDTEAALELIEGAAAQLPGRLDLQYHLARANFEQGNIEQAKKLLTEALNRSEGQEAFASRKDAERLLESLNRADG
ncbi:XrtA/PEP-CTERM system TPR-repeat protein PrsT [Motiliproteus sp. SC1-56]|uniref:XrtA/PEP-CTERM system TPR-repeat protein PrsT n=1 Tax=Motiliproteus sp. SC1-56 TaxID=2799565 RepID=UPI001A8C4E74|nr:XrtA/PEP-CTERM system TPR-repeat protein PrsT [Motiliproteus sp. SC1-56]